MRIITVIIILCFPYFCLSQIHPKIVGFSSDHRYDFDYFDGTYDSIRTGSHIRSRLGKSAIDPYRRKIYYINYYNYKLLLAYDLGNNSIDILDTLNINVLDLQYDMFMHCILLRTSKLLYRYDIEHDTIYIQCDLPDHFSSTYSSIPQAYNPYTKEYAFLGILGSSYNPELYYYFHIDILTGDILDTVQPLVYDSTNWNHSGRFWQYNFIDNKLYVIHEDGPNSEHHYLAVQNLSDASFQNFMSIPSDYMGQLNSQSSTYDQVKSIYLLPYYTTDEKNRLLVADLKNLSIQTFPFLRQTDMHHADYNPEPVLILENDRLIANFNANYTWYLDSVIISGEDQQIIIPSVNGTYFFTTDDTFGITHYSNKIDINWLSINEYENRLSLSPNPVSHGELVHLNGVILDNFIVRIYDINGRTCLFTEGNNNSFTINEKLISGIYFLDFIIDGSIKFKSKINIYN
jgi:hypothetical protein